MTEQENIRLQYEFARLMGCIEGLHSALGPITQPMLIERANAVARILGVEEIKNPPVKQQGKIL